MRSVYEETVAPMPWLTPTAAAMGRFMHMTRGITEDEGGRMTATDEHTVAQSIVHTRQDVAGLVSLQLDMHRQLVAISRGVWVLVVIAAICAWLAFRPFSF